MAGNVTQIVFRRTSCDGLFHAVAASDCGVGVETCVQKQQNVGLRILEKTTNTIPFEFGSILALIAMIGGSVRVP